MARVTQFIERLRDDEISPAKLIGPTRRELAASDLETLLTALEAVRDETDTLSRGSET